MEDKNKNIQKIKKFSVELRKNILEMAYSAGAGSSHFGGALSIVEIVSTLFSYKMRINKDPNWDDRDRFILSKGHACLAYYAALCEVGYISKEELKTFEKDDSNLLGHPVINKKLGIDFSNGSLGMGLSLGIGVSISLKKKNKNNSVFVVLGDGECNEGSVWEAAMAASNFKLDNLYAIIDKNNFQQTGSSQDIMNTDSLKDKWSSFGWDTVSLNGHDIEELYEYFNTSQDLKKPRAIIANTIKGKGFSFSENNNDWHHAVLTKSLYEKGLKELI
jgi:transketolase|tara:strand:+ start:620 stop:1444 length:825 start_codon:yes stop_codon:yes gene_type:complete